MRPSRWVAVFAAVAASAAPTPGQPTGLFRLDLTEPQLVLSPGGRAAACDVLTFTRDGGQLLAVGDDKVVHTWDARPAGLAPRPPLRWNVFRERRGAIYALALSPDGKFAAVGGFGRQDADVVILDRATGKVAHALSAGTHKAYDTAGTVWSLAYDGDGSRVAVGLEDGSVFVWTPGGPGAVVRAADLGEPDPAKRAAAVADRTAKIVWVGFDRAAVRFARGDGAVLEWTAGGPARELFRFGYPLAAACAPDDGRWLAGRPLRQAEAGTKIELRALPAGDVVRAVEFRDRGKNEHKLFPVALACDPAGRRLAVGNAWLTADVRFARAPAGEVGVYDLAADPPVLAAVEAFDGTAGKPATAPDAIAFHPTDPARLAVAGGHDHETGLWEVAGRGLRRVGDPALAAGRGVWQVGTAADGTVLCFRHAPAAAPESPNERGRGPWRGFDLTRLGWAAGETPPTETAVAEQDGWRVEFDPASEFVWYVTHPDGFKYPLPVNKALDDRPTCYTFLPAGANGKARLAVGCYWGFGVFEFEKGTAPRRVAKGVGHQGYVTSIAPARGGRMLVTGSNDQTVCVWALRPWDHLPAVGAAFEWQFDPAAQERRFVVTAVQEGSPAWEAGLLAGDRVARLGYDQQWVDKPAEWQATLADAEPDRELAFLIDRPAGGKVLRTGAKTRLLTRPQVRFFPTAGYDWVMYRYADYYFAAGGSGDAHLGWLLGGRTAADTPEHHPADRFREVFHAPERVRDSVLKFVREPDRPLARTYLPPHVEVTASRTETAADPVTLAVSVQPRADVLGKPDRLEKVELWLDDEVRLAGWAGGDGEFRTRAVVPAGHLRPGRNRLTVVAHARTRGEQSVEVVYTPTVPAAARVRGLIVGVNEYPYLTGPLQLRACANDVGLVRAALESLGRAGAFADVTARTLTDRQATPAAIFAALDELATDVKPDDWLVVFLAGHGFAEPAEAAGGGARFARGSWFFGAYAAGGGRRLEPEQFAGRGGPRELIAAVRKTGAAVGGSDLLARLAKVNCRKLLLLDSCHSGAIAQDPGRDLRPDGKGAIVLTAAAPDEAASEFEPEIDLAGKPARRPQGYFAHAFYAALTRDRAATDRNADGLITLEELHRAVARGVTDARRANGLDGPSDRTRQTVLAYPPVLRDVVFAAVKK